MLLLGLGVNKQHKRKLELVKFNQWLGIMELA